MKGIAYISSFTDKCCTVFYLGSCYFLKLKITRFFCFVVFSIWQTSKGGQIQSQAMHLIGVPAFTNYRNRIQRTKSVFNNS